ncbi:thioredoxin domain-containing protein [Candidatus Curtissbacteria bacterium]|nr:thioredoxin domain-containing protein [Candidatus Curtissbacteria bacterium]
MAKGGLHDHLQGGFFRYCVDSSWRIPHFEKMLYDQAMLLWTYSLGFRIFGGRFYKNVASRIVSSLEVFADNDLYYSATDADTDHQEGATYLWTRDELKKFLSRDEWRRFTKVYDLSEDNEFEGKLHLVKKTKDFLPNIERKLIRVRNNRVQPEKDKKIITSWNALLGIAFLVAGRYLQSEPFNQKGMMLYQKLLAKHWDGEKLAHSSLGEQLQKEGFLEDYASVLLLSTYIHEDTFKERSLILKLKQKVLEFFKDGRWMESIGNVDFQPVESSGFDHPTPSSISLAEEGLRRAALILGEIDERPLGYKSPLSSDFYNLVVFYKSGNFHEIQAKEKIRHTLLPANLIQLKSDRYRDCFQKQCREFKTQDDLLNFLNEQR